MKGIVLVVILAATACLVDAVQSFSINLDTTRAHYELNTQWEAFKRVFEKSYVGGEEYLRRLVWESNVKFIQRHNLEYDLGLHSYNLAMNAFGDLTVEEFRQATLRHSPLEKMVENRHHLSQRRQKTLRGPEDEIDWRTKHVVTEVLDQAKAACRDAGWAFAASGAVESQYAKKYGELIQLSAQQLIDCSRPYGTRGCSGGEINQAFSYVQDYGLESKKDYRYRADDTEYCTYDVSKIVTKCSKTINVPATEQNLHEELENYGPIAATIDASRRTFQFYRSGVYNETSCSSTNLNHGVLVVGCGLNEEVPFWIVKNSYGKSWGVDGYIYMIKDKNNQCGIASRASVCLI